MCCVYMHFSQFCCIKKLQPFSCVWTHKEATFAETNSSDDFHIAMSTHLATKQFGIISFKLQGTNSLKMVFSTLTECIYGIFQKYRWLTVAADLHMTINCSQSSACSGLCTCYANVSSKEVGIYFAWEWFDQLIWSSFSSAMKLYQESSR